MLKDHFSASQGRVVFALDHLSQYGPDGDQAGHHHALRSGLLLRAEDLVRVGRGREVETSALVPGHRHLNTALCQHFTIEMTTSRQRVASQCTECTVIGYRSDVRAEVEEEGVEAGAEADTAEDAEPDPPAAPAQVGQPRLQAAHCSLAPELFRVTQYLVRALQSDGGQQEEEEDEGGDQQGGVPHQPGGPVRHHQTQLHRSVLHQPSYQNQTVMRLYSTVPGQLLEELATAPVGRLERAAEASDRFWYHRARVHWRGRLH